MCCKLSPWALPPRRRHRTTLELPAFRGEALPGCRGRGRRGKQPSEISKDRGGRGRPLGLADCKTGRAGWRAGGLRLEAARGSSGQGPVAFFAFIFLKCLLLDMFLLCVCLCRSLFLFLSPSLSSSPTFLTPVTNNTRTAYVKPTCKNIRRILFLSGSLICSSSRCRL